MIDIINEGVTLDFGSVYCNELQPDLLYVSNIISKNTNYATWWASVEKSCQSALDEIISTLTELP